MNTARLYHWERLIDHGRPAARLEAALRGPDAADGHANQAFVFGGQRAEFEAESDQWSAKLVLRGHVHFSVGRRKLRLDEGHVLLLNPGTRYTARTTAGDGGFIGATLWFRHGLLAEMTHARADTLGFGENLRQLDPTAAGLTQRLFDALSREHEDPSALDDDLTLLLAHWWEAEQGHQAHARRLTAQRPGTQRELLRRIDRAVDFIVSCHAQPLTLEAIAAEAALSKSYLIRLFVQVHGLTPHRYLDRVRAESARRLLGRGDIALEQVACASGFGSRWALQRALKRHYGQSGRPLARALNMAPL